MAASEIANKIKEEATIVADRAEKLVASISIDQRIAEGKLLAAKPALDAAEAALLVNFSLPRIMNRLNDLLVLFNFFNADHQIGRYSDGQKIRETAIFDFINYGRGIGLFQEETGSRQTRFRTELSSSFVERIP